MNFLRQSDFIKPEQFQEQCFHIIGAGAVGSYTALILGKMGAEEICLYDPDIVENTNLVNQLYKKSDLGKYKVDVLEEVLQEHTETKVHKFRSSFDGLISGGIIISSVDSMESRNDIWNKIKNQYFRLYIDARMGGLTGVIYPVQHGEFKYEEKLGEDRVELPCTARGIAYTSSGIASYVGATIKRFLNGQETPVIVIDLELFQIFTYNDVESSPDF